MSEAVTKPTPGEIAERLTMALAEAGRPDLYGKVLPCGVCSRPRAFVGPTSREADREISARAFAVVFRRPKVGRVSRRSESFAKTTCNCDRDYRQPSDEAVSAQVAS